MTAPLIAFDALVRRHQAELSAYLQRLLGNREDAQDACQETWLRAYRAFGRLPADANRRAWLYKVATNAALTALKRRGARRLADLDVETVATVDRHEDLRRIAQAARALPPKQRAALVQRRFHGLEYGEIAMALGCSAASARAHVYQAMKKLRAACF